MGASFQVLDTREPVALGVSALSVAGPEAHPDARIRFRVRSDIAALLSVQQVCTRTPGQGVVAPGGPDGIRPGAADEYVVTVPTGEHVGEGRALQVLDADEPVARGIASASRP